MRKNIIRSLSLLIITAAFFLTAPAMRASAAEFTDESHYLKVDIGEGVLTMTQSTSQYDGVWEQAGITDPSSTLKSFRDMGVVVSFFDPASKLTVNLITNRTSSTSDVFSFSEMSDEAIIDYMNEAMSASSQNGTVQPEFSIERNLNALPFVRIFLDATSTDNPCSEIIYGTIVNGEMLQFDTFNQGTGAADESFLRTIVSGVSFTKFLTPEEYEEIIHDARIRLAIVVGIFVLLIAAVIFLFVFLGKKRNARAKKISDAMTAFREKMAAGEVDLNTDPIYTIRTKYDEALFERYGMFRAWIAPEPAFAALIGVLVIFTVAKLMQGSLLHVLILGVFLVVLLYMHYSSSDKAKDALMKRFDVKSSPTPTFRFYDSFFKVTGLQSAGEFIYCQVTQVRIWSGTLYIFLGSDQVLPIRISDLTDCTAADIKKLIRSRKKI